MEELSFTDGSGPERWMYWRVESVPRRPAKAGDGAELPASPWKVREAQVPYGVWVENWGRPSPTPSSSQTFDQVYKLSGSARFRWDSDKTGGHGPGDRRPVAQVISKKDPVGTD